MDMEGGWGRNGERRERWRDGTRERGKEGGKMEEKEGGMNEWMD